MNGGAVTPVGPVQGNGPRLGIRAGIIAACRGLACCGLMLAGVALLLAFVLSVALVMTWLGVVLLLSHNRHTGPAEGLQLILALAVIVAGLGLGVLLLPARAAGDAAAGQPDQAAGRAVVRRARRRRLPAAAAGRREREDQLQRAPGAGCSRDAATWRDLLWLVTRRVRGLDPGR